MSPSENYTEKENTNNLLWKGEILSPGNFHNVNQKKEEKTTEKGRN